VSTALKETDEIRRRMAQIRHELHQDVQEVVSGAEAVTDWRRYIRLYPWAAVGTAVVLGYVIVPKRRRSVPRDLARQSDLVEVNELLKKAQESKPEGNKGRSLVGAAFGMLLPLAWRVTQNYAMGYLEQWIAQQQQQFMADAGPKPGPAPAPAPGQGPGPGRPNRPRDM